MAKLLSRDVFRNAVFQRDKHICCVVPDCGLPAIDAHHILERALWVSSQEKEGYLIDNGASVCEKHHRLAERDLITPDQLRRWCGCCEVVLPTGYDPLLNWTKWGKEAGKTELTRKYPSTPYLSTSASLSTQDEDDSVFTTYDEWVGLPLIATAKLDGANVKLTKDTVAGRNGDTANNHLFDRLKGIHASIKNSIPDDTAIFAEWLMYRHSIDYSSLVLPAPLCIFGAVSKGEWLSWDDVCEIANTIGYPTVPVLGKIELTDQWKLMSAITTMAEKAVKQGHEGIVVRSAYSFYNDHFTARVAKYVRQGFEPGMHIAKMQPNTFLKK